MKTVVTFYPRHNFPHKGPAKGEVAATYKLPCGSYSIPKPVVKAEPKKYLYMFSAEADGVYAVAGVYAESEAYARDYLDNTETLFDLPEGLVEKLLASTPTYGTMPLGKFESGVKVFLWAASK